MKRHYPEIIRSSDLSVDHILKMQNKDHNSTEYGGIGNDHGLHEPYGAIGSLMHITACFFCPDSRHHESVECLEAMHRILDFIRRKFRDNGGVDNLISNFVASPGFEMHAFARAYRIMDGYGGKTTHPGLTEKAFKVLKELARGLYTGGFHTPNHRWVDAAGLLLAHSITGEAHLKDKALKFLAEGIDIDEYGEFTERSPGMYNAINDSSLMIIAEELGRNDILGHVRRNMDLLYHYIEPDMSVFTQNSRRKDKGETTPGQKFFPETYYPIYLEGARLFNDPGYAAFAQEIFTSSLERRKSVPAVLWLYMLEPALRGYEPEQGGLPSDYEVFYPLSGIVRKRKGDCSMTLLENNPNFLFIQKGGLRCYVRMCASFFAVAQFRGEKILPVDDGYEMHFTAKADYRMPMETQTSVWEQMDHSRRERVSLLELSYRVEVSMEDDLVRLRVRTSGCDRVPFKLEFCFSGADVAVGEGFMVKAEPGHAITAGPGHVTAFSRDDSLTVGPGFMKHFYTGDMRGSVPASPSDFTIHFTDYTNIDRVVEIRAGGGRSQ
ncbi:MAG: hypothetical protein R6W96_07305 [Clostridia bacterium]